MSIKDLALQVKERNKRKNRTETQSFLANKNQQNIHGTRKPREKNKFRQAKIVNGELICLHPVEDLATVIINLTEGNLSLQKRLLLRHCQQYSNETHFWNLALKWEVKTSLLESKGHPVDQAEILAAEELGLLAFMDELKEPQQ